MTIVERLGGRKAAFTFSGQIVLLLGYVFCTYAEGDSPTFLTFTMGICALSGVAIGGNAYVHKVQKDESIAATKASADKQVAETRADASEAIARTQAEADKAIAETKAG